MTIGKNPALWTAVILHLVVFLALLLSVIVEALKPKEKLHVFEMVSPPAERSVQQAASDPMPAVDLPDPLELPAVPDAVIPEPTPPAPPVAPTPPPKVAAPAPTPPKPKLVDYKDFVKENPIKQPKPRTVTTQAPRPVPTITVPTISIPTPVLTPSNQSLSSREVSELQRYGAQLNARLNQAWIKPPSLANSRMDVDVSFDVSASGRISNVRFRPASGNSTFYNSIRMAFAKITSAGPTPTGQSHTFRATFSMAD